MRAHFIFLFVLLAGQSLAQHAKTKIGRDTTDLTFSGTKIDPYQVEFDSSGHVFLSGYLDTYYASYRDSTAHQAFSKFPTIAPRNNQFGLNIAQASVRYISNNFRGTVTAFGGDTPLSSWSPELNFIQEANVGFKVVKKLWLDAGFFRTHIGLESIQPRENITMSLATASYFEPYYMSGAKLTWQVNDKFAIQVNAFNSFNTFIENNKNKAVGFSTAYAISKQQSIAFSTIVCDESPDSLKYDKTRWYNNLIYTFKSDHWNIGAELNYGTQQNSRISDSTATATVFSAIAAVKYRITPKWALYTRCEYFSDQDEIFTGPLVNSDHQLVGLDVSGVTGGVEYKPIPNSYFRVESRYLQTKKSENFFYYDGNFTNVRTEIIAALGVWF